MNAECDIMNTPLREKCHCIADRHFKGFLKQQLNQIYIIVYFAFCKMVKLAIRTQS